MLMAPPMLAISRTSGTMLEGFFKLSQFRTDSSEGVLIVLIVRIIVFLFRVHFVHPSIHHTTS